MYAPVGCLLRSRNLLIPTFASGMARQANQYKVNWEVLRHGKMGVFHRKGVAAWQGGAGSGSRSLEKVQRKDMNYIRPLPRAGGLAWSQVTPSKDNPLYGCAERVWCLLSALLVAPT